MKVLLSVIVFTLYTVSYAQNMKMIDTSMPKKDKKDAVVPVSLVQMLQKWQLV